MNFSQENPRVNLQATFEVEWRDIALLEVVKDELSQLFIFEVLPLIEVDEPLFTLPSATHGSAHQSNLI